MGPAELQGLTLYEHDEKLLTRWWDLKKAWERAYPHMNIGLEVAAAHAWEVANPKRQKTQKARFLNSWLNKASQRAQQEEKRQGGYQYPRVLNAEEIERLEAQVELQPWQK